MKISRSQVEDRFEEAATTLRRVPNPAGSGPRGYGSSWPDYVRDPWHAYGYHAATMRVIPSAAEISRMEECLEWLAWLSADDARIVWMRAGGSRWAQVGRAVGLTRSTCWRRWVAALVTVERRLNAGRKPGRAAAGSAKARA
jgi:hypothetical protein